MARSKMSDVTAVVMEERQGTTSGERPIALSGSPQICVAPAICVVIASAWVSRGGVWIRKV
jgi:hypothetical protein